MFNFFFRKPDRPDELASSMHSRWWLEECWLSPPLPVSSNLRRTQRRILEELQYAKKQLGNSTNTKLVKRVEYLESFKLDQWVILGD